MKKRFFLDTSIIIAALTKTSPVAFKIVFKSDWSLHTIDYVMRETYHVLRNRVKMTEAQIGAALDELRKHIEVHRDLPAKASSKLNVRDKADKPMIYAAMKMGCILIIQDEKAYQDAKRYVEVVRLKDLE